MPLKNNSSEYFKNLLIILSIIVMCSILGGLKVNTMWEVMCVSGESILIKDISYKCVRLNSQND